MGLTLLAAGGCTSLQPVAKPTDHAAPPANGAVWASLDALPEADRHLLLNEGLTALDRRLRAIDSAVASIDLQTFLWRLDAVGAAVARHLLAAADRGVTVRILVDDTFLLGEDATVRFLDGHPNIRYRVWNPHRTRSSDFALRGGLNLLELRRLDHRMHNKLMVVDNRIAITGGRNLADEYFGIHRSANFRDLELLVAGPVVERLSGAFDAYWNDPWAFPIDAVSSAPPEAPELAVDGPLIDADLHREQDSAELAVFWGRLFDDALPGRPRVVADDPPRDNPALPSEAPMEVADFLIDLFDNASEEIVILSAYLIPTPELEQAVARAIRRGVDVRILTNSLQSNNHTAAHGAYSNHVRALLGHGVELYEVRTDAADRARYMLRPTHDKALALHAKALLVDRDEVFIGSANLDPRSLRINTELGLLVESRELNSRLREVFRPDFRDINAWNLQMDEDGRVLWVSGDIILDVQPADSFMQRIEDWFFAHLPLEAEL